METSRDKKNTKVDYQEHAGFVSIISLSKICPDSSGDSLYVSIATIGNNKGLSTVSLTTQA